MAWACASTNSKRISKRPSPSSKRSRATPRPNAMRRARLPHLQQNRRPNKQRCRISIFRPSPSLKLRSRRPRTKWSRRHRATPIRGQRRPTRQRSRAQRQMLSPQRSRMPRREQVVPRGRPAQRTRGCRRTFGTAPQPVYLGRADGRCFRYGETRKYPHASARRARRADRGGAGGRNCSQPDFQRVSAGARACSLASHNIGAGQARAAADERDADKFRTNKFHCGAVRTTAGRAVCARPGAAQEPFRPHAFRRAAIAPAAPRKPRRERRKPARRRYNLHPRLRQGSQRLRVRGTPRRRNY